MMKIKKICFVILGCLGLGLGAIGAVLPVLPTVPFLMLAAYCFARSSERLNQWFINTNLYKKNLESYVQGRGMTGETKLRVILTVTLLMSIGFFMMLRKAVYIGCSVLFVVWVLHIIYFVWGVKTCAPAEQ